MEKVDKPFFLIATHIKEDARKRTMLLYYAGGQIHDIFKTP